MRSTLALLLALICAVLVVEGILLGDAEPNGAAVTWVRHPTRPFSVSATEVTVGQFKACVAAGACDAATANPACNLGRPDRDDHPVNCVSYQGAQQFCEYVGSRVCTEQEWLDACRGTDARTFPYGSTFDLAACNVQSTTMTVPGRARETAPVGQHSGCEGGLTGLFDMAGNVAEWVDECKGSYCRFRGAGYLSNDPIESFASCGSICSGNDMTFQSGVVGIRCCKDVSS